MTLSFVPDGKNNASVAQLVGLTFTPLKSVKIKLSLDLGNFAKKSKR